MTVRTVYVISPEKVLKLALTYPASTGRNFDEVCAEGKQKTFVVCVCVILTGCVRQRAGGVFTGFSHVGSFAYIRAALTGAWDLGRLSGRLFCVKGMEQY